MKRLALLILAAAIHTNSTFANQQNSKIAWQGWSDDLFVRAKAEKKLVILDLEAIWCHWCHVMDEKTYSDPKVQDILTKHFISVRVDQDSRPDLSNRYEDYGWPATILFNSAGQELAKRSGYIPPDVMLSMLQAFVDDPTPGPSAPKAEVIEFPKDSKFPEKLRNDMEAAHRDHFDQKLAGWGSGHKFMDWSSVEYSMLKSRDGDTTNETMARRTLDAQLGLIDPVWGGVYQYSVTNWKEPHFEKIMQFQAENMRTYAMAYARWQEPKYLQAAQSIRSYLENFLSSPEGSFYTSQDADVVRGKHSAGYFKKDDKARRKAGMPRIDTNQYARENGWAIRAYAALYDVTSDPVILNRAIKAADWVISKRSIGGGGFHHNEVGSTKAKGQGGGPFLNDTMAMAEAFLALYRSTGDRVWLQRSRESTDWIAKNFANPDQNGNAPCFVTAKSTTVNDHFAHVCQRDENISAARLGNLLYQHTGEKSYQAFADRALRYLAAPQIAMRLPTGGVIQALVESVTEPTHITIVGAKNDENTRKLFLAALKYPSTYRRVELWDKSEGNLPRNDVTYPALGKAAAFACSNSRCSLPIFDADAMRAKVDKIYNIQTPR